MDIQDMRENWFSVCKATPWFMDNCRNCWYHVYRTEILEETENYRRFLKTEACLHPDRRDIDIETLTWCGVFSSIEHCISLDAKKHVVRDGDVIEVGYDISFA